MITIRSYKGVDLQYNEGDGMVYFDFEGQNRKTKYAFEAEQIIDEPIWGTCDLEGYFLDGYTDKYIGIAKATKINVKTGEPYWLYKGQYDREYKRQSAINNPKVFLKNPKNDQVYTQWQAQREIYRAELAKLNNIANLLK